MQPVLCISFFLPCKSNCHTMCHQHQSNKHPLQQPHETYRPCTVGPMHSKESSLAYELITRPTTRHRPYSPANTSQAVHSCWMLTPASCVANPSHTLSRQCSHMLPHSARLLTQCSTLEGTPSQLQAPQHYGGHNPSGIAHQGRAGGTRPGKSLNGNPQAAKAAAKADQGIL